MKSTVIVLLMIVLVSGCSTFNSIFPDRSKEYQQAESLPDLEIPPDLTADAINNSMSILGENRPAARPATSNTVETTKQAVIQSINNNRPLLSIPDEFTVAWIEVENILENAGVVIKDRDQSVGTFDISYSPDAPQEDEGFFSRIAFWNRVSSRDYQLSLTGVGNKTELVILDEKGEWNTDQESDILLTTIRDHYNLTKSQ